MRLIDADVSIEKIKSLPIDLDAKTIQRCIEVLSNMSSAVYPWIPCSERPPRYDETEETSEYLVTDKGGRVRHCLLDPYMPETFVTVEEGMIVDAVAWRPAPEPWKGGTE